ncbi:MAG TPA: rhodanese-like domain-containing protein [Gemmatimonadaceae bacterium]|nr:rhodanese-like domain-containing protein [Gemmatimonadaceae bacterium]
MLLHRLYDDGLAQASYLLACERSREAIVIDPNRDPGQYTRLAASLGLKITHVTETHVHADFVSGALELAAKTGATLHVSGADPEHGYAYEPGHGARALADGDVIELGRIRIEAVHTPGHTPEHMSFVVADTAVSEVPLGAFTGDFIFVGDVGRPDLLERAVGVAGSSGEAAAQLFHSLRAFAQRPDFLQIWPGHGAGSACGKSLSATPQSTLGYERLGNWALQIEDEAEFVRRVLEDQTEPPAYFAEMKRVNRKGPRRLDTVRAPAQVTAPDLGAALQAGCVIVDTRPAAVFAREHIAGSLNVPLGKSFTTWAGSVVPYDAPLYVLTDIAPPDLAGAALRQMSLIGLDEIRGWTTWEALADWNDPNFPLIATPQMSVEELMQSAASAQVLDVRNAVEWRDGHLDGATHIPLADLRRRMSELDPARPVVVHCQGGGRSAVAASLLQSGGMTSVTNLTGGYAAWRKAGFPVEVDAGR